MAEAFTPNVNGNGNVNVNFPTKTLSPRTTTCRYLFGRNKGSSSSVMEEDVPVDTTTAITEDDNDEEVSNNNTRSKTETLRFGGRMTYTSTPLPLPEDISTLAQFMTHPDQQYILLCGAEEDSQVEFLPTHTLSTDFITHWKNQADRVSASPPNLEKDCAAKVQPAKIQIFTVKVCPESTVGVSMVYEYGSSTSNSNSNSEGETESMSMSISTPAASWEEHVPEYQAVLIDDEPRAEGPQILVWLFDKIVHGSKKQKEGNSDQDEQRQQKRTRSRNEVALLRVSARPVIGDDTSFTFTADTEMWLEFQFPKWLLSFFPMSQEKAEQISGDAIVKALEMNLIPAIDRLCDTYLTTTTSNTCIGNQNQPIVVEEEELQNQIN